MSAVSRGTPKEVKAQDAGQLSFVQPEPNPVVEELRRLRIEEMSPLDAMTKLGKADLQGVHVAVHLAADYLIRANATPAGID